VSKFGIPLRRLVGRSRLAVRLASEVGRQADLLVGTWVGHDADPASNGEELLAGGIAPSVRAFIDVGANVGDWTSMLLGRALPHQPRGLLLEPSDSACKKLRERFELDTGIEIVEAAVSDIAGRAQFFEEPDGGLTSSLVAGFSSSAAKARSVPTTTLDREAEARGVESVDILKIDAEGWDLFVLRGARGLLSRQRVRIVQFEYNRAWRRAGATLSAAFLLLESYGYEVFLLRPQGLYRLDPEGLGEFFEYSNFVGIASPQMGLVHHLLKGPVL
jgi:FkbM family methyltransferase